MSKTESKVATFVKDVSSKFKGEAKVFALNPPIGVADWGDEGPGTHSHVVVSAVSGPYATETFIFGSTEDGEIVDWGELNGSFQGGCDIERALRSAGYEVTP